jgi:ABC-type sugar transport system ATPase subunit
MTLAHRIVVMRAGKIEQVGTPLELYNTPANRFVAGFIGAPHMNFLSGEVVEKEAGNATLLIGGSHRLLVPMSDRKLSVGDKLTIGIRPQHITLANDPGSLRVRVRLVEALGSETVIHADLNGEKLLAVVPGQRQISPGDDAHFSVAGAPLHLFDGNGSRVKG